MPSKLTKFTLAHNNKKDTWDLTNDKTDKVVKRFEYKQEATQGGVLSKIVGNQGGSVKIKKMDNHYQEERTYPRSADPKKSKG
ncbi:DUF2188 domain-containing protein [soil metagenome]